MSTGLLSTSRKIRQCKRKRRAARQRTFRSTHVETLEDRRLLAATGFGFADVSQETLIAEGFHGSSGSGSGSSLPFDASRVAWPPLAAYTGFLPEGVSRSDFLQSGGTGPLSNPLPEGPVPRPLNMITVGETEPNDTRLQANPIPLGRGAGESTAVEVVGTIGSFTDVDFFQFELQAGDIFGAVGRGAAVDLSIQNGSGIERQGTFIDTTAILAVIGAIPDESPLPRGGNTSVAFVAPESGTYYMQVGGAAPGISSAGPYTVEAQIFRPVLEDNPVGTRQKLFIDFDGAIVDNRNFGVTDPDFMSISRLSSLDEFLPGWGLDERNRDAVIDAILETVEEAFDHVREAGNNGDFSTTGRAGSFDIEILNSRDHDDPWGLPNVSRVIVGGGINELLIPTIGIADAIDVGNFSTERQGVVLLDLLSLPDPDDPNSLNSIPRAPTTTIIDVIGVGVGRIVAHEAGHFFGAWHQDNQNLKPTIMDTGGNLPRLLGVGDDGIFGTDDDVLVQFAEDRYEPTEFFTGIQDVRNMLAFALSTGTIGGTVRGVKFADLAGNGVRDPGDPGLEGFTIYADLNNNGQLDPGEPRAVTNQDGRYELTVPPGTHTIREVEREGFELTFPAAGRHVITVSADQVVSGIDFGNHVETIQAVGTAWLDSNRDGIRGPDDPGIPGVWIYVDLNNNGRIDLGDPATLTDANGNYSLTLPGPGTFTIREVTPPGFVLTSPEDGAHTITVDEARVVGRDFVYVADVPVANDIAFDAVQGMANELDVLANDVFSSTGVLEIFSAGSNPAIDDLRTVQGGTLEITADQTILYTPPQWPGFFGVEDSFRYTLTDRGDQFPDRDEQFATAEVTIFVLPSIEQPVANDNTFDVSDGDRLDVLANDLPGHRGPISIVSVGSTLHGGSVSIIEGGGALSYTPPPQGFAGKDQFTYTIADSVGASSEATVTIQGLPGDAEDNLVDFILQPRDMAGNPLPPEAMIEVGDHFQIQVLVEDLRIDPQIDPGVQSAYMDLLYDSFLVNVESIEFSSTFASGRNFDLSVPNIIDEVGAFVGLDDTSGRTEVLFTVTLQAMAVGQADFQADPADDLPLRETIVRTINQSIPFEQIGYGSTSVLIVEPGTAPPNNNMNQGGDGEPASAFTNPVNRFDVNGDGAVSPMDALIVINALNRDGVQKLGTPGGNGEGEAGPPRYYDVDGDGYLAPMDALMIINYLNRKASMLSGEGEAGSWNLLAGEAAGGQVSGPLEGFPASGNGNGGFNSSAQSTEDAIQTAFAADVFDDSPLGPGPIADEARRHEADALDDWESWMDDELLEDISSAWQ